MLPRVSPAGKGRVMPNIPVSGADSVFDPRQRGPTASMSAVQGQYSFLDSTRPSGYSQHTPASRTQVNATNRETYDRLAEAAGRMARNQQQVTYNEKTGSGQSYAKPTQHNFTSDYFQIPKPIASTVDTLMAPETLPWVVVGVVVIYVMFFRQ